MSVLHVAAQTIYTHHCGDESHIQVLIKTLGQNTASISRDGHGRLPLECALRSKKDSVDAGCLMDAYPAVLAHEPAMASIGSYMPH
jgi:hypothetical protein